MTSVTNACQNEKWYSKENSEEKQTGFGTFVGVFVPCILMVFGVIIFLRLGWIVGMVGLPSALTLITIAAAITFVTTLSMASISTNIEVRTGGVYYIISRSLGLEVGSAVGLPLFFKQALSIAFCVIGFAESLHDLVPLWSITSIGLVALTLLTVLAYFSLSGALKLQVFIFAAIIASLVSLFMGSGEYVPLPEVAFSTEVARPFGFWTIFAIFFPAMTGVESSVSLSGDLKNPSRSLPLGTITAMLTAYAIYMIIPIFLASQVSLDVLASDPLIMQTISKVPSLIILGIWGATISSALGGLLGAPRTLQALANDGVLPRFFGKTFGAAGEPRVATLTTFCISFCGVYFGSVNIIAPLLTMVCLICYGVLNFSAGLETFMANPSWRPRFAVHWAVSFTGALLCLITMLMIDVSMALTSLALIFFIYLVIKKRQLDDSLDDVRYGLWTFIARFAIYRLAKTEETSKSWRPNFLVFNKKIDGYSHNLLQFAQSISQSKGFLTIASILSEPMASHKEKISLKKEIAQKLAAQNIDALVQLVYAEKLTAGMNQMLENYGIGTLTPNTIVFGGITEEDAEDFAAVINNAYQRSTNIVILHERAGDAVALTENDARDIHIWWDDAHIANSRLMLVLGYMLKSNPSWRKASLSLKATVENEMMREQKSQELASLFSTKRLTTHTDILVSANLEREYFPLIENFSKEAGIIFLSLRPPKEKESIEEYASYLKMMTQFSDQLPPTAFVLSSHYTPLEKVM